LVILFFIQGMIGMEGAGGNLFQSVPLSRWFVRKRGKAMSLAFLGTTAGMFAFTPLIQYIITIASWRYAWLIVGCSSCLVIIIVALIIIRKDPESMGLQPDGDSVESEGYENRKINPSLSEYPWTRSQAIRTFSFWALIAIMGLRMFSMGTVNIFRIPFYIDQGISAQFVAWAISAEAVISALVSIPTGWAVDRFQPRYVAAVSLVSFIAVMVVTMYVTTTWHVFVATTLFGVSAASFIVSQNALWPNYFGGRHIGSIRGFAIPLTLFFSAIGAPIAGRIKDVTGSYMPAWLISIACLSIATALMLMARKPKPPVVYGKKASSQDKGKHDDPI
jgi:MFS family permease